MAERTRALIVAGLFTTVLFGELAPLRAQATIETDRGLLEVIGLRTYTIKTLQDSLSKYAPGQSLQSHACAAYLRNELHFPAAAVNVRADASGKRSFVVTVVEPGDSASVSERTFQGRTRSGLWQDLYAAGHRDGKFDASDFAEKTQFYGYALRSGHDSAAAVLGQIYDGEELARARKIFAALGSKSSQADFDLATEVISSDARAGNRAMAASVLMNFADRDASWHALAGGMRDAENGPREAARLALRVMTSSAARKVDWAPAVADLRFLLGGTNVWVYTDLLNALVATELAPDLATSLLADNWHLLIAHTRAHSAPFREPAATLVTRLSGLQDGTPALWQAWAEGLKMPR